MYTLFKMPLVVPSRVFNQSIKRPDMENDTTQIRPTVIPPTSPLLVIVMTETQNLNSIDVNVTTNQQHIVASLKRVLPCSISVRKLTFLCR